MGWGGGLVKRKTIPVTRRLHYAFSRLQTEYRTSHFRGWPPANRVASRMLKELEGGYVMRKLYALLIATTVAAVTFAPSEAKARGHFGFGPPIVYGYPGPYYDGPDYYYGPGYYYGGYYHRYGWHHRWHHWR